MKDTFSEPYITLDHLYHDLETYAAQHHFQQTLTALPYAKKLHANQFRKGEIPIPYIYHPLLLGTHALALGFTNDDLIAAALLHDVCEDCAVSPEKLPVNTDIQQAVALLTRDPAPFKDPEEKNNCYYSGIAGNKISVLIKLLDRCHNVSGMASAFSNAKIMNYIAETEKWVYPLFTKAEDYYPEYSRQIFLIKYHMCSVVESLKQKISW